MIGSQSAYSNTDISWQNSLFAKIAIPVGIVSIIGLAALWYIIPSMLERNIVKESTLAAQETVAQFKMLRGYYTQNIIKKVIGKSEIKASFNHQGADKTIPLPATLIHDMSALMKDKGTSMKLYSSFPFPNRKDRKLDAFGKDAWNYLLKNPEGTYTQRVENNGHHSVRVAISDKMVDQACVSCHNAHPDTPFASWKLGDVRGVLEVETNIDKQIANGVATSRIVALIVTATFLIILGLIWFTLKRKVIVPIKVAASAATEIANGNLNVEINYDSSDEAGKLLSTLQVMRSNLSTRIEEERQITVETSRIKQALDNVNTNVMIADQDGNIIYINQSLKNFLTGVESEFQKDLPNFTVGALIGSNMTMFFKNPADQPRNNLSSVRKQDVKIGEIHLQLVSSPIIDIDGYQQGIVVEWMDRYQEVVIQEEMHQVISDAMAGNLKRRINLDDKEAFFKDLSEGINQLMNAFDQVISDTASALGAVASGDLTQKIESDYQGEFGQLKNNVNTTIDKLTTVVNEISGSANLVLKGSQEIMQGNVKLSDRTVQQSSNLVETAASMEEMTTIVRQNADNAEQANQLASNTRKQAEQGGNVVDQAVSAMSNITESSNKIAAITNVIDEIAFQTNLLALNAAVEAAHAGEQGRGFAVVASEVRNLAGRSADAAKEIKILIEDSAAKVDEGSKLVDASGQTLREILGSVKKVSDIIAEIAKASQEQSEGISQVNKAVLDMDLMTQQNSTLVEEATSASDSMSDQAKNLNKMVGFFKTGNSAVNYATIERRKSERPWTEKPSDRAKTQKAVSAAKQYQSATSPTKLDDWKNF